MMSNRVESAANNWEVERRYSEHTLKPYCILVLRNRKKKGESVVKASSSDYMWMQEYAEQLNRDLYELTNDDFVEKYQLCSIT